MNVNVNGNKTHLIQPCMSVQVIQDEDVNLKQIITVYVFFSQFLAAYSAGGHSKMI